MIIVGAGGLALEVLDLLLSKDDDNDFMFFDDVNGIQYFQEKYRVLNDFSDVKNALLKNPDFVLAIGGPKNRWNLFNKFSQLGGKYCPIKGLANVLSKMSSYENSDIMNLCFLGSNSKIGFGVFINTGVQIHHEVEVGDFSEISPGAILLGKCKVGKFSTIGAGVKVLPNVKIGDNVLIGAGAVVVHDIPSNCVAVGIPAKVIKYL